MNNEWRLDKLTIEFCNYGEHKGQHVGQIHFQNKDFERFVFQLSPEETKAHLDLIALKIIETENVLVNKLIESLNL